jgi:hypothetical protein
MARGRASTERSKWCVILSLLAGASWSLNSLPIGLVMDQRWTGDAAQYYVDDSVSNALFSWRATHTLAARCEDVGVGDA